MNKTEKTAYKIGLISDTHGVLRSFLLEVLKNVDLIVHAGDVCDPMILQQLESVAPVLAVRGNRDRSSTNTKMPWTQHIDLGPFCIHVVHDISEFIPPPLEEEKKIICIHGHTHKPSVIEEDHILYVNPGSIGPQRSGKPMSFAFLYLNGDSANVEFVDLETCNIDALIA